jgi:hypothetical protein
LYHADNSTLTEGILQQPGYTCLDF